MNVHMAETAPTRASTRNATLAMSWSRTLASEPRKRMRKIENSKSTFKLLSWVRVCREDR